MNAIDRIRAILALDPAAQALEFEGTWFTWSDLARIIEDVKRLLLQPPLGPGAPVGIVMRNRPGVFAAALGVLCSGRCIVTLNPMLPADKLSEDIAQLNLPAIIACPQDISAVRTGATAGAVLITADDKPTLSLRALPPSANTDGASFRPHAPGVAVEMLTSGTTGRPKRIKLPLAGLDRSLTSALAYESRSPNEIALKSGVGIIWSPLSHISGFWATVFSVFSGRAFALMERFNVEEWHDLVVRHRPKLVSMPPTALRMVLDADFPKADFASLLAIRGGAAPLDPDLADTFHAKYGVPFLNAYGATEFAGAVAGWTLKDYTAHWASKRDSVGRAQPGVELRVVDPQTSSVVPAGEPGVLEVKTAQVSDPPEWVRTNDLARLDKDGFLFIVGRLDGAIVRGGFKLIPDDIAAAIKSYPGMGDVCVFGLADARLGQIPVAAFEMSAGASPPSAELLKNHLRGSLKPFEIPVMFRHFPRLPRTPALKVDVASLRRDFDAHP